MCLSTLCLLGFQLYWVGNAMKVNEERFNQDVHMALNAVALNLEKQEVIHRVHQQQKALTDSDLLFWVDQMQSHGYPTSILDQNGKLRNSQQLQQQIQRMQGQMTNMMTALGLPVQGLNFKDLMNAGEGQWSISLQQGDSIYTYGNSFFSKGKPNRKLNKKGFGQWKKQQRSPAAMKQEQEKRMNERNKMVQAIVDQMFAQPRTVAQKLKKHTLDSLLHAELGRRGMHLDYEYGVTQNDHWLMSSHASIKAAELVSSDFYTTLYPNDFFNSNTKLLVNFPNKDRFLLGKVGLALGSSLLLVLVMILCFGYAIHTILHQKKISEMKNDFVNNMTHEFKTPIATVSLACEALADPDMRQSGSIVDRYLGIIRNENKRLGQQVEKVLQVARMDRKKMKVKWETVDVIKVAKQTVQNIALQVEKRGGSIQIEQTAKRTVLRSDRVHLTNIIENLLDNANKYSQGEPHIRLQIEETKNALMLSVIDQGCGMSKEHIRNIFDKFYRISTGNLHDVKGFGLGLSYVKSAVEAIGGEVEVSSQLGKGSTFTLFLPYGTENKDSIG
ncbi:two-component sensor histidine kinase [Persicobacter psychrovividus]|uniref:histidine kinase n=2 Tax=Persicobacter psychrovividus TaxID=387638 RepID=A0ABM7VA26_9BACT|nr:two-component sensor histidine kinase [Persicobacter psychrovividus]